MTLRQGPGVAGPFSFQYVPGTHFQRRCHRMPTQGQRPVAYALPPHQDSQFVRHISKCKKPGSGKQHCSKLCCLSSLTIILLFPSQGSVGMDRVLDFLRQMSPEAEEHDLEELNKTLDPEERDSSVDLEAFQTVVKEWMPRYQSTW